MDLIQIHVIKTRLKVWANKLSHVNNKYYHGRLLRFMVADKDGVSVYCNKCGNIANGVKSGKVLYFFSYTIPYCRKHLKELM